MILVKGQNTLPALVLLIITLIGTLGMLYQGEKINQAVEYNTDYFNKISEAKLRAQAYEDRTKGELLYTSNTEALLLGDNAGGLDWRYNIPSYEDLKQKYLSEVGKGIRSQNDVIGCSNPNIDNVKANITTDRLNVTLSEPWITCRSEELNGLRPTEASVNISREYAIKHPENRYLDIVNYSSVVSENASWIIEEKWSNPIQDRGTAEYCQEDYYRESEMKQGAREEARQNFLSGPPGDISQTAYENTAGERPGFLNASSVENSWPDVDRKSDFIGIDNGRFTNGHWTENNGCSDTDCSGTGEDRDCDTDYYDVEHYGYIYRPDWVDLTYGFYDSGERIINSEARLEKLDFSFTHRHEVN